MNIFIAHSARGRDLARTVATLAQAQGFDVFDPSIALSQGGTIAEIYTTLRSSDLLVAIVTGENANIFYELGLAAGASIPTLIAAPPNEKLPIDLAAAPFVQLAGEPARDAQLILRRL